MIEQTASVVEVGRGYAWVVPQQQSGSCSGCTGKSCAATSPFDFMRSKEPRRLHVLNPLHARVGDKVIIGMQGEALVWYSVLAYLLPLVSLLVLALLGQELFTLLSLNRELGAVLGGIAGLFSGLRFITVLSDRSLKLKSFQPVILRIQEYPIYANIAPSS